MSAGFQGLAAGVVIGKKARASSGIDYLFPALAGVGLWGGELFVGRRGLFSARGGGVSPEAQGGPGIRGWYSIIAGDADAIAARAAVGGRAGGVGRGRELV